ncbi:MAG: glycosyltransferase family 2 protein [Bacteroidaceae bacterium]|nr:glycosyltransferase family 2 protein [Bacteroidaceae bacterium]
MLSILIPTKDYNCCKLVESLHAQCEAASLTHEIIVGEDGSSSQGLSMNAAIDDIPQCRRVIQATNIGRAAIRNLLAKEAKCKNIMFIDSDAVVEHHDIIAKYTAALQDNEVVCGGLYHATTLDNIGCSLRYKYEKKADKLRSAAERAKNPYDKFSTFCFAIRRRIFQKIEFSDKISKYGHEDTLFGRELQRRGIAIKHIDAPLLHSGLESNSVYLEKVRTSIETLVLVENEIESTPLLQCYRKLQKLHLATPMAHIWRHTQRLLCRNLLGKNPSLTILGIYKIGFLCNIKNNIK